MEELKIGDAARQAGVSVDTLRYYERRGVLRPAQRRASGYRVYEPATVARIRLVKTLQALGLSLEEVVAVLDRLDDGTNEPTGPGGHAACAHASGPLATALERIEAQLAALTSQRDRLASALTACRAGHCPVVTGQARSRRLARPG